MSEPQCSDIFDEVFDSCSGGCVHTCDCGITHFDVENHWDWEPGELEGLQKNAIEQPTKYKACDGTVGYMWIDGREIVYGCSCDKARKYERFIVDHAAKLAEYLNKRAEMLRRTADEIAVKL